MRDWKWNENSRFIRLVSEFAGSASYEERARLEMLLKNNHDEAYWRMGVRLSNDVSYLSYHDRWRDWWLNQESLGREHGYGY